MLPAGTVHLVLIPRVCYLLVPFTSFWSLVHAVYSYRSPGFDPSCMLPTRTTHLCVDCPLSHPRVSDSKPVRLSSLGGHEQANEELSLRDRGGGGGRRHRGGGGCSLYEAVRR